MKRRSRQAKTAVRDISSLRINIFMSAEVLPIMVMVMDLPIPLPVVLSMDLLAISIREMQRQKSWFIGVKAMILMPTMVASQRIKARMLSIVRMQS